MLVFWSEADKDASIVFSVGANAGIYNLAALAGRPDAVVHAFEPMPEIADRLRRTADLNGLNSLIVHETVISDKSGKASLWGRRGELGTNEGMNYLGPDTDAPGTQPVTTGSLDDFCRERGIEHVQLIKIDLRLTCRAQTGCACGGSASGRDRAARAKFRELDWTRTPGAHCPATACIDRLAGADYKFSSPHDCRTWRDAGDWLRSLGDVVARRV